MHTYVVRLNDSEYMVMIGPDGSISVNGHDEKIDVQQLDDVNYSAMMDNTSIQISAKRVDASYHVLLNGDQVDVFVETERDQLIKKYAVSSGGAHQRYEIHAPMPALVVKLCVGVGDEVRSGQPLIVLEAMKMENEIKSHQSARVKEVYASTGKPVEKGELLMLLE